MMAVYGQPIRQRDIRIIGTPEHFEILQVGDGLARPHASRYSRREFWSSGRGILEDSHPRLWIFQGQLPGHLSADEAAIKKPLGLPPYPFTFSLGSSKPVRQTNAGEVRVADSSSFIVSKTIAVGLVTIRPGALRKMHWHPNADEWAYWIKGKGRMTVFETGPNAVTWTSTLEILATSSAIMGTI
jgi:hypothetical protein